MLDETSRSPWTPTLPERCIPLRGICPWGLIVLVTLALAAISDARPQLPRHDSVVRLPLNEGKNIRFTRFSVEQGLSQSRVDHMLQDDLGFMWFGTYNGLNRYDGYHFKVYKPEENNPNSMAGVFVTPLFKDRSGVLWIGIDQGLDRFDPVTQTFTHFRSDPKDPRSLAGHLEDITQDSDGMLWLATRNGLDRLDPVASKFTHFRNNPQDPHSLSSNDVRYVLQDKSGTLWVATATGLNAFDRHSGSVTRYPGFQDAVPDRIYEDRSGLLWVSSTRAGGLASLDRKTGKITRYTWFDEGASSPSVRGCSAIIEDQYGMLWLATDPDGVVKFDRKKRQFTRYRNDPSNPASLSSNVALSLIEDREGGIWVGTGVGGVNRFSSMPAAFTSYRREPGNPNSLDQDFALSVFEDSKQILWIGTWGGDLNRVDRKTGRYTRYHHDPADAGSIANGTVFATAEDRSGYLWFGTWGGGLNRFDRKTGRFKAYRHSPSDPSSLSENTVLALHIDRSGALWAGTLDGVSRFDPRTERFTVYRDTLDPPPSRIYRVMAEGPDGSMWLGTYEWGLQRLDIRTGKIAKYMSDPKVKGSLSNNRVNALCVDKSGQLWVGTQNGLDRFDPKTGEFVVLNEHDGLPNNAIQGILEDAEGYLWVSTGNGLSKFDPRANTFKNYYVEDGLAGNEFNNYSIYFKSVSGEMFFGGPSGITAFHPEQVVENPYVPPIVLTDFRLFNNPVRVGEESPLQNSISYTDSLTLSHEQSIFSIEFSSLSFANPQRNRYRYMLEGLEKTWNEVGSNQRFVTYTTLPTGRYTFRVQGSSSSGVWNPSGIRLVITILPPWWQQLWFLVTASTLLLASVWTAYYLRIRGIKRRNRELTDLNMELQRSRGDLLESEGKLAEAQRIAHVGHWSYDVEADNFDWSDETYSILGLQPDAGVRIGDQALGLVHREDRPSVDGFFESLLTSGQPCEVEHRVVRPNGEIRYLHLRGNPIAGGDRGVKSIFGTVQDITERKLSEDALRRLNRELRVISNVNEVLIHTTDEQELLSKICRIVCQDAGYHTAIVTYRDPNRAEAARPLAWAGLLEGDDLIAAVVEGTPLEGGTRIYILTPDIAADPDLARWCQNALRLGYRSGISIPLQDHAPSVFGVLHIYSGNPDAFTPDEVRLLEELSGNLAFGIVTLRTRAEHRQAEQDLEVYRNHLEDLVRTRTEELEKANLKLEGLDRLKSMFIASTSHELRTPLNSIIGFTGTMLMEMAGPISDEQRRQLTMVKDGSAHLLALVNDVIDISTIEAGNMDITLSDFDLVGLVRDVADSFAVILQSKGLSISVSGPEELIVKSDRRRARQILVNLVGNSAKFTDQGHIALNISVQSDGVEVSVSDTGVGISQPDLEKLFQAFAQLGREGYRREGSGLGLYLSKRIAEALGGTISARSTIGKGSVFSLWLPLTRDPQA